MSRVAKSRAAVPGGTLGPREVHDLVHARTKTAHAMVLEEFGLTLGEEEDIYYEEDPSLGREVSPREEDGEGSIATFKIAQDAKLDPFDGYLEKTDVEMESQQGRRKT